MGIGIINQFFFKRAKKQLFVIVVFLFLTAFLMNLGLMLSFDYKENFYRECNRLNTGHVTLNYQKLADADQEEAISSMLSQWEDVEAYSIVPTVLESGSCAFGDGTIEARFSFIDIASTENCAVGRFDILSEKDMDGIYLPYIFEVNDFVEIGDSFDVTFGETVFTFPVKGFYHHPTTGSTNCSIISILVDGDTFRQVQETLGISSICVSIRLKNTENLEIAESGVITRINDCADHLRLIKGFTSQKLASSRYSTATICMGVILAASVICVIALLAVIVITLSDIVKKNIRNLGTLKAMGYMSKRIIFPVLLSFFALTVCIVILGVAASYLFFPAVNTMIEEQVGIPYALHFMPLPAVLTLFAVLLTAMGSVFLSIVKIRRIVPIMAIRMDSGKQTGKQILPLPKTRLPVNLSLSLKSAFSSMWRNLVIFLSIILVALLSGFDCFCYQYIISEPDGLMLGIFGNMSDYDVYLSPEQEDDFLAFVQKEERVEGFYLYSFCDVCHDGGYRLSATIIDDQAEKYNGETCISGRFPQNGEEVAVNCYYMEKIGAQLGDPMTLSVDGNAHTYKICGAFQDASSSGRNVMLQREGYTLMSPLPIVTYSLLLSPGAEKEALVQALQDSIHPLRILNFNEIMQTNAASYIAALTAISICIFIISMVIIVLMLYIIITIVLGNKKREYGILKALGFRTRQLVFQTAFGLMPFGVLGVALGMAVSKNGIAKFLSTLLKETGLAALGGPIPLPILLVCGTGLVLVMFLVACLLSRRIKDIVPHDLFNRE